jgi:hypothetical protein
MQHDATSLCPSRTAGAELVELASSFSGGHFGKGVDTDVSRGDGYEPGQVLREVGGD